MQGLCFDAEALYLFGESVPVTTLKLDKKTQYDIIKLFINTHF